MGKVHINTTISQEDYNLCKDNGWMFSRLLASAIREKREEIGIEPQTLKNEIKRKEAFQKLSSKYREFLEKEGLIEKFLENDRNEGAPTSEIMA